MSLFTNSMSISHSVLIFLNLYLSVSKSICSLAQGLSVFDQGINFTSEAFAVITQPLHDFTYFSISLSRFSQKKHIFSLKLPSLIYHCDQHGSHLIFFFLQSSCLVSPPICCTSNLHHREKKSFHHQYF